MTANGRLTTDDLIRLIEQKTGRHGRKVGRETVLECPSHEGPDSTPSLNVREGDGGYPLIQCRSAGCTAQQVLEAVGVSWGDVFGDDGERWTPSGPMIAVYDYVDADGTLLYQVCRTADKKFSQRRPDPSKPKGFAWNLNQVKRVPFRLPNLLLTVNAGEEVFICDGERDVLALEQAGVTATCCNGGMLKWPAAHSRFFVNAKVAIVVDQDPLTKLVGGEPKLHAEGQRAAKQVYDALRPVAASVRLVRAKEGKDAADHLGGGHGVGDFVEVTAAELDAAIAQASATQASEVERGDNAAVEEGAPPRLRFLSGPAFVAQPLSGVEPLLGTKGDGLMMPGSLMLLAGIGGAGKTTLSLHMMAHWAAGLPWFGIEVGRPIRMVVIENEGPHDPYVEKVKEFADRFDGCTCSGEPHGGGHAFLENCIFMDAPWGHFSFDDLGLAEELRGHVIDFNGDLVIANPLGRLGMKGAGTPEETREFLQLLTNAGLGEDFAALLLHHLAKVQKNTPLVQQVSGDWGPHPDTIMVMESAGERRSKLSFGKIRWGDQGRAPLILNWLTDPAGPIGYKVADAPAGVPDDEMFDRIDAFMREQTKPLGITAISKGVTGQNKRIRQLVEQGVQNGRYASSGGARPTYWLLAADAPTAALGSQEDLGL